MPKNNKTKFSISSVILTIIFCAFFANFSAAQVNPNTGVEATVIASFPDMPAMITVAKCESGYRQFNADGSPLRGGTGKGYIGIFQIDEKLHKQRALDMAYDINTVEGNIAYARYMYFKSGTNPWKGCLSGSPVTPTPTPTPAPNATPAPAPTPAPASPITGSITTNLKFGMTNPQILILQQILNNSGYVITASGAGSPGNETSYFGSMTREALRRFQCAKAIACSGNESTTGYGMVGPRTRAALNN